MNLNKPVNISAGFRVIVLMKILLQQTTMLYMHLELISLRKKYRSKGLGFQAFSAAIEYYKAHGIDEVYTQTWSGNTPMIRLAQKIGFKLVDVKKDAREHNGKEFDALTFKI